MAFRNLATGTNAYTDVHHTAYTLTTAGTEGTLALLPVFLDHVLYPTITDAGFVTEVYHVDGEGAEAGVVFSEMQAIENESGSVAYLALRKALYPGACGYAMETGGIMSLIRSLTVEQIREYHGAYYRPDNCFIVVAGKVQTGELLSAVDKLAPKLADAARHPPVGSLPRPFTEHPVPELAASEDIEVEFPADEEDSGCVMIGWRAHQFGHFGRSLALNILHAYLTESELSVLHSHFVEGSEGEEGVCAGVSCGLCENGHTFHYVSFDAVRSSAIAGIKASLIAVLQELCAKGLDMARMATIMHRFHIRHLNALEDSPHDTLAHYITLSLLFGREPEDAGRKLRSVFSGDAMTPLQAWTSDEWVALLKESMLEAPMVCVRAVPSAARAAQLAKLEEERLAACTESLGKEGLQKLQDVLDEAMETNDTACPDGVLSGFAVPSVQCISLIPVQTAVYPPEAAAARQAQVDQALAHFAARHTLAPGHQAGCLHSLAEQLDQLSAAKAGGQAPITRQQIEALPVFVQLDNVPSDFVELRVVMSTEDLTQDQRAYLELYLEAAFSLPVRRGPHQHSSVLSLLSHCSLPQGMIVAI